MSRKNLSRTVIEGGRYGRNKWDRRYSSKKERVKIKQYLHEVVRDVEHVEEIIEPTRDKIYKSFKDKLGPMYRWIDAQVGRPWAEVYAEIKEKFDGRTTAGRHILYDHLLPSIIDTYQDYFVSDDDILCKFEEKRYIYQHISEKEFVDAGVWLDGRIITEKGGVLYWCYPSDGIWKTSWVGINERYDRFKLHKLKYYLLAIGPYQLPGTEFASPEFGITGRSHGEHWEVIENPFSFRQRGLLSEEEIKQFKLLKSRLQKEILKFGKGR